MFGRNKKLDAELQSAEVLLSIMGEVLALEQAGEEEAKVRSKIDQMLEHSPDKAMACGLAMGAYLRMGDTVAALTQCAIGMALEPGDFGLHIRFAAWLRDQGKRADAERILEAGWQHAQKRLPKHLRVEERAKLFSILDKTSSYHEPHH